MSLYAQNDERRPVGPPVDVRPALLPGKVTLAGRHTILERLNAARHGPALWDAFRGRNELWTYSSQGPFSDVATFNAWLAQRSVLEDPFYFSILDRNGRALGVATLMEIRPAMRVIEVGHIVYGLALQRTPLATDAQFLLARYAFETLGYRRYEWKCDALNAASRRAAERLGFTFEGIFRQHMILKGRSRDTAWFSMLDSEWLRAKEAFEQWLAPANFDAAGRQRRRLAEIRAAIS
ncbi:MAG TPA: GNAT family protein [Xanthobacteraceae bacterium]